jgi:hypothetical protein
MDWAIMHLSNSLRCFLGYNEPSGSIEWFAMDGGGMLCGTHE